MMDLKTAMSTEALRQHLTVIMFQRLIDPKHVRVSLKDTLKCVHAADLVLLALECSPEEVTNKLLELMHP